MTKRAMVKKPGKRTAASVGIFWVAPSAAQARHYHKQVQAERNAPITDKSLPITLSVKRLADIKANGGWYQFRFGAEFIEQSYVVAHTEIDARKQGTDYDTSDHHVYRDPGSGLFWRDTGFFD